MNSLYPSVAKPLPQLKQYYRGYPRLDGITPMKEHDFEGAAEDGRVRAALEAMHGFVHVTHFDQSAMLWPALTVSMSSHGWSAFAPVLRGSGWFSIPRVLLAYHLHYYGLGAHYNSVTAPELAAPVPP